MPQIVIGDRPIGGAVDLARLDRRGALLPLAYGEPFPVVRVRRRLSLRRLPGWLASGGACPPWSFRVELVEPDGRVREAVSGLGEDDARRLSVELDAAAGPG